MQEAADLPDLFAGLAHSVVTTLGADAALISQYEPQNGSCATLPPASWRPPA